MAAALSSADRTRGKKAEKAPEEILLEKLKRMVDKGLITQGDYDKKKDEILAQMSRGWLPLAEVELLSDGMELKHFARFQIYKLRPPSVPYT